MRKQMEGDRATEVLNEGDRDTGIHPGRATFGKLEGLRDKDWGDSE